LSATLHGETRKGSTDFWLALREKVMSVIHQDMVAAEDPDLVTVDDGNSIQGSALSLIF